MGKRYWVAFGLLLGGIGLLHAQTGPAPPQRPGQDRGLPLTQRLAKKWNMTEAEVRKKLEDLGQEVQKDLGDGRTTEVPGLGTLRVIKLHLHRETVDGKPVIVENKHTVQLVPLGALMAVANSPGARAAEEILPRDYFYHDLPYGGAGLDRTQGHSVGSARDARPSNKPSQKVGGGRRP